MISFLMLSDYDSSSVERRVAQGICGDSKNVILLDTGYDAVLLSSVGLPWKVVVITMADYDGSFVKHLLAQGACGRSKNVFLSNIVLPRQQCVNHPVAQATMRKLLGCPGSLRYSLLGGTGGDAKKIFSCRTLGCLGKSVVKSSFQV